MIRRGFWLAVGAALGITGYRKAARLARAFTGQSAPLAGRDHGQLSGRALGPLSGGALGQLSGQARGQLSGGARGQLSGGAQGHLSPARPHSQVAALPAGTSKPAGAAWPVRLMAGARAATGFVHDVREGMAEYRDLHGGQLGRSLGSQVGQIASDRSPRGPREP